MPQELTTVSEEKPQLKCIHELSVHLLYLEPIFDGNQVREDLKGLTVKFQQLTLKIFSLLEEQVQVHARTYFVWVHVDCPCNVVLSNLSWGTAVLE